jgi:hypothetical protein
VPSRSRAAQEQSTAAGQAQTAIRQQANSLEQSQAAAQALASLAEVLQTGRADAGAPHQIGAAAEQLSATVQRDLEQINALSQAEGEKNRTLSETLTKVEGEVAALSSANVVLLDGAEAMLTAITEAAQQIAAAAEQSSTASRQAASASAEQAQGAEDLAAAIEEIASLADELGRPNA